MQKQFKFSVIIPIYNVEEYLEETIESVINQTIGFKDNIELILINDGSPDNSEKICLKYKKLYPDNVIYYKQKNAGVSAARNKGIELATGELVNFLDSDDKWSLDTFKIVYNAYKKHPNIKMFSTKMEFFDAKTGGHMLNYKYKKNKIVDILKDYEYIQLSSCSLFIKNEIIKKYSFDSKIKYAEDVKLVNEILIEIEKYMILKKPIYYYRRRFTGDSAIQKTASDWDWYFITPKYVYNELLEETNKKYKQILPFIQYTIMYDLQWRLKCRIENISLTKKEIGEYINSIKYLLKKIDDNIILGQKFITIDYKIYALNLKYEKNIINDCQIEDSKVYFNDIIIYDLCDNSMLEVNVLNLHKDTIEIIGQVNYSLGEKDCEILYEINGKIDKLETKDSDRYSRYAIDKKLISNKTYKLNIPYKGECKIDFYLKYKNEVYKITPAFTIFGRLSKQYSMHYIYKNRLAILKDGGILIKKNNIITDIKLEVIMFFKMLSSLKIKPLIYRYTAQLIRPFIRKKIWLVSDRTSVANDNGMHMFKYIINQNNKKIKPYFVISSSSKDYEKMEEIGPVINYGTFKYKIMFLLADKIISSQADGWVINAFGRSEKYYRDLYRYDFVFLQHGVTNNDMSEWLNKINKNISIFVTSAKKEYDSIVENPKYFYTSDDIKLTGMPRYDNLTNQEEKMIAIMPTWRKALGGVINGALGTREYNPDFKKSNYYKFYNDMINNEKLLELMRKKKYKGIFVIHPSHIANAKDFKGNDVFKIIDTYADYQEIFKKSKLLISDYSSVLFDFAYLRKPIVYCRFDKKEFYASHIYDEGYFDAEKMGFGKVLNNYNDSIKEIINLIDKDCKLDKKYEKRINDFFSFNDRKSCERVYNEIINLDKRG